MDRTKMNNRIYLTIAALALTGSAFSAPQTYRIVNNANAKSIATVESVTGVETIIGKGPVTGSIVFDPAKGTGSGSLSIAVKSIDTGIPLRDEHMRGEAWLNEPKHPAIVFKATKVQRTGKDAYRVTGNFTLHGVTKPVTVAVALRHVPTSAQSKKLGFAGDAVQLTTKFKIKLSDFGVQIAGKAVGKVNNEVTISVAAFGDSK
jgi:polyisoprenoid-binding protein YceI